MKYEEEQSWLCQQLVKEAHDAIIMADREGIIRLWNKGAEMIFGFGMAEALGQSLHIIIPENLRERHDQGYHQVMESGHSKYFYELAGRAGTKEGWQSGIGGIHHDPDKGSSGPDLRGGCHHPGCFGTMGTRT